MHSIIKVETEIMRHTFGYLMGLYRKANSETSVPSHGLTFNEWIGQLIDEQVRIWEKDDRMLDD